MSGLSGTRSKSLGGRGTTSDDSRRRGRSKDCRHIAPLKDLIDKATTTSDNVHLCFSGHERFRWK